ncbi:MAG: hypothetical protein DF168_01082 [Candidatus Moanabacter tarae]|uniref:Uncharacterized protein n=1 Tax=Candidatus Moanibacter tarae TaxID=2200854 RepID=A0A2Z4AEK0_9BACT|nr:MAG: hypothetical protein DF168_01082 [Candidatus Moanabacter tarae]
MPEFEDCSNAVDPGLAQKQPTDLNELNSSSTKPENPLNQPIAPHRGEAVEYIPQRSNSGISDSKEKPFGRTQGSVGDGNLRARRNIRIRNAYTKKNLPASIARMPKSPKGPNLFTRLKTFLIRLLKRFLEKNDNQSSRSRYRRRRNKNRRENSRKGYPRRRERMSNQERRGTNTGRKRNGTKVRNRGSQQQPQKSRDFSIIRDSTSDRQNIEKKPSPKNLATKRNRSPGRGQKKPNSSTN